MRVCWMILRSCVLGVTSWLCTALRLGPTSSTQLLGACRLGRYSGRFHRRLGFTFSFRCVCTVNDARINLCSSWYPTNAQVDDDVVRAWHEAEVPRDPAAMEAELRKAGMGLRVVVGVVDMGSDAQASRRRHGVHGVKWWRSRRKRQGRRRRRGC